MTVLELILMGLGSNVAAAFNITVTLSVLLLLFPYFWSGIALIKKDRDDGIKSWTTRIIVLISSIFIVSAFVSANLDELWLVIVLVMVVMAVYSITLSPKKKNTNN